MEADRQQWFLDRVGKRVFRNNTNCCEHCQKVYEEGLIIADREHALYLYDVESDLTAEGNPLRYFDTKEEVLKYESELNASEKSN